MAIKEDMQQLGEMFEELLIDAMNSYSNWDPNNFRKTAAEQYKDELDMLKHIKDNYMVTCKNVVYECVDPCTCTAESNCGEYKE